MSRKKYNFIDIFSGCGGISTGLEMAGHRCLLGVDFDRHAAESFRANHPNSKGICMDIAKLTRKRLERELEGKKVDMVVGGPPCQGFSTAGRNNADDPRNRLFEHFVRVVKITSPKIVIFENVTGILSKKNRSTLEVVFKKFEKLGYSMSAKVLSADEHGTPSRRKRAIIMGVKGGVPSFPKPRKKKINVREAFASIEPESMNHNIERASNIDKITDKRLSRIPAGFGVRTKKDEEKYLKGLEFGVDWESMREKRFRQMKLQRLPWDLPAPTILTASRLYYHPCENRFLTVREAACCQGFPMDFNFKGPISAQFRQVGNAVPPPLAKSLGDHIARPSFGKKGVSGLDSEESSKAFKY